LQFNIYLKHCRERYHLTQEQLVQELYNSDKIFEGLDVSTISRWERAITRPSIQKQIKIVSLFSSFSDSVLSCFNDMNKEDVEDKLCKIGVKNIIGSSKEHILNFPSKSFKVDDILVKHIRSSSDIDKGLQLPYTIIENLTGNAYNLNFEIIKSWALNPSNLFLISEYQGQFHGLLFTLRLKPDIFNEIINFDKQIKDICEKDFASFQEMGSNLPMAFFAYNDKSSTLLILRYYAHLIANQNFIESIGTTPLLEGAKKIVQKMNLKFYKDKEVSQGTLSSYSAPLSEVLINERVLKMIFQKQDCPEDND
jgi:transcriptional regulator with XRE-family HTH domain